MVVSLGTWIVRKRYQRCPGKTTTPNATWMTVVPGHVDLRSDMGYQTANVVESLRRASDILEPHGLVMVLELLNPHSHPGRQRTFGYHLYLSEGSSPFKTRPLRVTK